MNKADKALVERAINQMEQALTPDGYRGEGDIKDADLVAIKRCKDYVAYWSAIGVDDSIYHSINQACHAGLGYGFPSGLAPRIIVNRIQWENNDYRQIPNKIVDRFLQWLTKESAYAGIFLKKGGEPVRKLGYLVVRTDVPANLMVGGLIAARMLTEHYGRIVVAWGKLVERGVHPSIAFMHANSISCKDHENVSLQGQLDWHVPNDGNGMNRTYVLNFKNGVLVNPQKNFIDYLSYGRIHALWGETRRDAEYYSKLAEIKKEVLNSHVVEAVANPFLKKRITEECPIDAFMDRLAPYLIDYYGDDNV